MARSTRTRSANEPSSEHCLFLVRSGNHTYPLARDHSRKNALEIAAGEHCYATTTGIRGEGKIWANMTPASLTLLATLLRRWRTQSRTSFIRWSSSMPKLFKTGICTPVLKRPSDIGLDYEDVFFPSLDGIPAGGLVHSS